MGVAIVGFHDLVGDALVGIGEFGKLTSDKALGGEDGVFCVRDGLALGGLTDETFSVLRKSNNRRSGACTFRVFEDHWFTTLHDRHAGVGGAEVNS